MVARGLAAGNRFDLAEILLNHRDGAASGVTAEGALAPTSAWTSYGSCWPHGKTGRECHGSSGHGLGLPGPAEFPHGPASVPDLGHMADLAVLELHHVDVVGAGALAGGGHRAALASVGAGEHGVGADVVALMVGGEGLDRVGRVRDDHEHSLHPLGVLLERLRAGERLGLGREARVGLAVGTAHGPAFSRLAGVEESSCRLSNGLGGGGHDLTPSPSCRLWTPGAEQEG